MKIVISHSKTKRVIRGPFDVCGSREDLLTIVNRILATINRPNEGFGYGWVEVYETQGPNVNSPPINWDAEESD